MEAQKVYPLQLVSVYRNIPVLHAFLALASLKLQECSKNGLEGKKYLRNMYMEIGHIAVIHQNIIINVTRNIAIKTW